MTKSQLKELKPKPDKSAEEIAGDITIKWVGSNESIHDLTRFIAQAITSERQRVRDEVLESVLEIVETYDPRDAEFSPYLVLSNLAEAIRELRGLK